jgi:uncharacterized coiled-coil protein SlyX
MSDPVDLTYMARIWRVFGVPKLGRWQMMSDLVKELLARSSDEAGIGWTPTTVVHVPAGLLHEAADRIAQLEADVAEQVQWVKDLADMQIKSEARIAQLEAALRFYADESLEGYDFSVIDYGLSVELGEIIKDGGAKARAALKEASDDK